MPIAPSKRSARGRSITHCAPRFRLTARSGLNHLRVHWRTLPCEVSRSAAWLPLGARTCWPWHGFGCDGATNSPRRARDAVLAHARGVHLRRFGVCGGQSFARLRIRRLLTCVERRPPPPVYIDKSELRVAALPFDICINICVDAAVVFLL